MSALQSGINAIMYDTATQSYNQWSLYPSQRTKRLAPKSKPLIRSDPSPLDWQPGPQSNLLKVTYWISFALVYRLGGNSWPDQQRHWSGCGAVRSAEFLALHFLTERWCPWSITWTQAITLAEAFRREANQQLCVCSSDAMGGSIRTATICPLFSRLTD